MSSDPKIAETPASKCPLQRKSIACRWANPGDLLGTEIDGEFLRLEDCSGIPLPIDDIARHHHSRNQHWRFTQVKTCLEFRASREASGD